MASSSSEVPIESLLSLVRDAHTVDRSGVAAAAALVFDILITLDQEVEFIWKSAWTIPKVLYIFSRYFALAVQIINMHESTDFNVTNQYCHSWTLFEGIAGQLLVMGVEISLMLRVYALYKRDKRILALLLFLYAAEVSAITVILGMGLKHIVSVAPLRGILPSGLPLSGCFPTFVPSYFYSYWIPPLIFESILFFLMAINFIRLARSHRASMPFLSRFVRDGTMFYAVIFVILLIQVLLYELVNSALAQVAIAWELTVFSVAGSRLILNLRASGAAHRAPSPVFEQTLEMMQFDKNPAQSTQVDSVLVHHWKRKHGVGEGSSREYSSTGETTSSTYNGIDSVDEENRRGGRTLNVAVQIDNENREAPDNEDGRREDWISEWENV